MLKFGQIIKNECENVAAPVDSRCSDAAFALANPDICGGGNGILILKPGSGIACLLGSIQFKAFLVKNGVETDVTSSTTFTSSDTSLVVIGASSGNATGIAAGNVVISALYADTSLGIFLSANANLTVFGEAVCCDEVAVALMVLVDNSKSMSQAFSSTFPTRLHYAKYAANRFISEINGDKDVIGLMRFNDNENSVLSSPSGDVDAVAALTDGITQSQQLTGFNAAIVAAIAELNAVTADERILLIISDGEATSADVDDKNDAIATTNAFKGVGGIVMCFGARASGSGFLFLEAISTGGFFLNAYPSIQADALDSLTGLKGYVCAGNCVDAGDRYEAKPQLHYCGFINWHVSGGAVDLFGPGLNNFLPDNGQYVNLFGNFSSGATEYTAGKMTSKDAFSLTSGHSYRVSFNLAGNQVNAGSPNTVDIKVFGRDTDGLTNPVTAPTVVVNESGATLAEELTYKYVYAWVNANGETEVSPAESVTPTTADASMTVTPVVNGDSTSIRIYRTTGAVPQSPYYLIAEVASGESYTDFMSSSDMLAALALGTVDSCANPSPDNMTGSIIELLSQSITINDHQQPFTPYSFSFIAPSAMSAWISIEQTAMSETAGLVNYGILLDSVKFDNITTLTNLLDDDFEGENVQYIPPACGVGTTYVPTMAAYQLTGEEPLIPLMTGDTSPSGVASASTVAVGSAAYLAFDRNDATKWTSANDFASQRWIQYQFDAPVTVTRLVMELDRGGSSAFDYSVSGSNNGVDFDELYYANNADIYPNESFDHNINNVTAYLYYRITFISPTVFSHAISAKTIQLYSGSETTDYPGSYGYMSGYNCYGIGCLNDSPPAAQLPDPNPLPNIEQGYAPPQTFYSGRQVCVTCGAGTTAINADSLEPDVTDDAVEGTLETDGTVTQSGDAQKVFTDAQTVFSYSFVPEVVGGTNYVAGLAFNFQGSNNGTSWTTLDSQAVSWLSVGSKVTYLVQTPTAFKYYRVQMTGYDNPGGSAIDVEFTDFLMQSAPDAQKCASADASSELSQQDADNKATAAATAEAEAQLNCLPSWTATEQFTATCPEGTLGVPNSITKSATYVSLISQLDAEQKAQAAAQVLAEAALTCLTAYESTQEATAECPLDTTGDPVTKTASYTSVISQEDADEQAYALALAAAEAELECVGTLPSVVFDPVDGYNVALNMDWTGEVIPYMPTLSVPGHPDALIRFVWFDPNEDDFHPHFDAPQGASTNGVDYVAQTQGSFPNYTSPWFSRYVASSWTKLKCRAIARKAGYTDSVESEVLWTFSH